MPLPRFAKAALAAAIPVLAIGAAPAVAGLGPQDGHRVTIVVSGPGLLSIDGWLSIDPGNLPVTTLNLVPNQDMLTALAVPYGSGEFAGWGGACSGNFEACGFDLSEDRCLVAGFQPVGGPPIDLAALNAYCPQALGGSGVAAPPPAPSTGGVATPGGSGTSGPAPAAGAPRAVVVAPGAPAFARAGSRLTEKGAVVTGVVPATARRVAAVATYLPKSGAVRSAGTCTIRRRATSRTFNCTARTPLKGRWQVVTQAFDAGKHVVGQTTAILTVR